MSKAVEISLWALVALFCTVVCVEPGFIFDVSLGLPINNPARRMVLGVFGTLNLYSLWMIRKALFLERTSNDQSPTTHRQRPHPMPDGFVDEVKDGLKTLAGFGLHLKGDARRPDAVFARAVWETHICQWAHINKHAPQNRPELHDLMQMMIDEGDGRPICSHVTQIDLEDTLLGQAYVQFTSQIRYVTDGV